MIILGINFGHDSSATIIRDGKILAAIEEEKVSRIKQDFGWPRMAIERLFSEYEIEKNDVSVISIESDIFDEISSNEVKFRFSKKKIHKFVERIRRIFRFFGIGQRFFNPSSSKKQFILNVTKEGFTSSRVEFFDHHLAHAASVAFTSPVRCDVVVTSDGMGGDSSFNFYEPNKKELILIKKNPYHVSIGAFYSMVTKLLGFRPTRHEGKITGLAAFGEKTELVERFNSLWKYEGEKLLRYPFDNSLKEWARLEIGRKISFKDKINLKTSSGLISSDYAVRNKVLLFWLKEVTRGFSKEDIAFACQKVAEDITLNEIRKVLKRYNNRKLSLGLAGGVFANVKINQLIYELENVENIFIQPAMGDSGLSLGCAILSGVEASEENHAHRRFIFHDTFLGPNYSEDLKSFIETYDYKNVQMEKLENPGRTIAELLYENQIIGLWNGRVEWGPRALGNRSIILNTFDKGVNDSLNARLNRTEFMPFAPVVLDKFAETYFPGYDDKVPAADYMTMTYDTAPMHRELLQATVHVDGTARPQIAYEKTSPLYYSILNEFYKITGCAALVNTSFNAHEEPILSDPSTAIRSLISGRVDYLLMENYLFTLKNDD